MLCFANIPPPLRLDGQVILYFHNVLLAQLNQKTSLAEKILLLVKRYYIKWYLNNVDVVWVQSKLVKRLFFQNISSSKEVLEYPFFETISSGEKSDSNIPVFVYVSNGMPHKNHLVLLKAWELAFNNGINYELHLTVTEEHKAVIAEIKRLKEIGVNILNHGYTDATSLYRLSNYMIYPSLSESFGLGLVEAVSAGLKVIAADKPYVYEMIKPSFTFNSQSSIEIYDILLRIHKGFKLEDSEIIVQDATTSMIQDLITSK